MPAKFLKVRAKVESEAVSLVHGIKERFGNSTWFDVGHEPGRPGFVLCCF